MSVQKERLLLKNAGYSLCYVDGINANKTPICGIALPFKKSNLAATFSRDGVIKIYDITNWITYKQGCKQVYSLEVHKSEVISGSFSQDLKKFIAGSKDNCISLWDLETGYLIKHFQVHKSDVVFVQFINKDQLFCTAGMEGDFKIWKTEGGKVAAAQDNILLNPDAIPVQVEQVDNNIG